MSVSVSVCECKCECERREGGVQSQSLKYGDSTEGTSNKALL